MQLRIHYRGAIVWNVILFILFSFVFLYLQEVFYNLSSVTNRELLLSFLHKKFFTVTLFVSSIISVYFLQRYSKYLVILVIGVTTVQTILNLNLEFSKMILVLLFFYLLLFFYVFQFYLMELSEAYYNSRYQKTDLFAPMLLKLSCVLIDTQGNKLKNGILTNWSGEGCFIKLDEPILPKEVAELRIQYKQHEFRQNVVVATSSKDGLSCGVKFSRGNVGRESTHLGWAEFYEIIENMGYSAERLA